MTDSFLRCSAICMMCLLSSCHTTRHATAILSVDEHSRAIHRDTIYLHDLRYDSVYVSHTSEIDRTRDTITIIKERMEYRYRLMRDTIYQCHTDTLVKMDSIAIPITPHRGGPKRSATWLDHAAYTSLVIVILYLMFRIRSPILSLIRRIL